MSKEPGLEALGEKRNHLLKKATPRQKGFTLIEVMIALFVLTVAIGTFIGTNMLIQRNAEMGFERSIAIQDANRVLERMRNISRTGTFPSNVVGAFPNNTAVPGFTNLTSEQVTVTYASTTVDPLDVTVTVTWLSQTQRASVLSLRTVMTQR